MNINKKITIALITALVITIGTVVLVYAEYVYVPAWNAATGRYTQVYEMKVDTDWNYTTRISPVLGDSSRGVYLQKMYPERECVVQCTNNELTTFPTYYKVFTSDAYRLSYELEMTGNGVDIIDFINPSDANNLMCLGIRTDPRSYGNEYVNKGNWSPDTY